ncbi:hypothetical protein [Mesorhizobium wenxiniae]|uniref:hypothetical protein n=1 Tax=Mesorhizobium wenxiniae TaxID=2014805 RepID=UPI00315A1C50
MDWTAKYPDLVYTAKRLVVESAIIDGGIIVPNEAGLADFAALRKAIRRRQHALFRRPSISCTSMAMNCATCPWSIGANCSLV